MSVYWAVIKLSLLGTLTGGHGYCVGGSEQGGGKLGILLLHPPISTDSLFILRFSTFGLVSLGVWILTQIAGGALRSQLHGLAISVLISENSWCVEIGGLNSLPIVSSYTVCRL